MPVIQSKTGKAVLCALRPETVVAIRQTFPPERECIFGSVVGRRQLFSVLQQLLRAAGLQGGTRELRRSSATWVEVVAPGSAMAHLGHRTPGLAYRSYVDPRIIAKHKPMPPKIE